MPAFGEKSKERLAECDERLQNLFNEVIKGFDCIIICGQRGQEAQEQAFEQGYTQLHYPNSKHNVAPSRAVDVMPYPVNYADLKRNYYFVGYVRGIAEKIGIKIRIGADWNMNGVITDQTFIDLPHVELIE